jgi:hypothetical protein
VQVEADSEWLDSGCCAFPPYQRSSVYANTPRTQLACNTQNAPSTGAEFTLKAWVAMARRCASQTHWCAAECTRLLTVAAVPSPGITKAYADVF